MKLNHAPQAGLRRRRPDHRREIAAFWAGIAIMAAFELVLMAKQWSPSNPETVFGLWGRADQAAGLDAPADAAAPSPN